MAIWYRDESNYFQQLISTATPSISLESNAFTISIYFQVTSKLLECRVIVDIIKDLNRIYQFTIGLLFYYLYSMMNYNTTLSNQTPSQDPYSCKLHQLHFIQAILVIKRLYKIHRLIIMYINIIEGPNYQTSNKIILISFNYHQIAFHYHESILHFSNHKTHV